MPLSWIILERNWDLHHSNLAVIWGLWDKQSDGNLMDSNFSLIVTPIKLRYADIISYNCVMSSMAIRMILNFHTYLLLSINKESLFLMYALPQEWAINLAWGQFKRAPFNVGSYLEIWS